MKTFAVSVLLLVILVIYNYFPDFFDNETTIILLLIVIFVYLLPKSNENKIIYGGTKQKYTKMDLMDPKHNLREIAKQLILLEDHMAHKHKRCIDCMTKHYLMVEGLLEEAITLDKKGEHTKEIQNIMQQIQPAVMNVIDLVKKNKMTDDVYHSTCQILRKVRKEISVKYVLNV
jgi:hypothetical protein